MSTQRDRLAELIAENASLLGEDVKIGAHYLEDGRVRIFDLAVGWRRLPYQDYSSIDQAIWAGEIANARARRAHALIGEGYSVAGAVRAANSEIAP